MSNETVNFTLKKPKVFRFALEDEPEKVYELPPLKSLGYEEAQIMADLGDETKISKQGPKIRKFILDHCPELEKKNIADMEYYEIFNAYAMSEGASKLGESEASRNS